MLNLSLPNTTFQVHESALKRSMTVTFEVLRESGPPHMRTFRTRCVVGEFIAEGEGNGKKVRVSHSDWIEKRELLSGLLTITDLVNLQIAFESKILLDNV